MRHIFIALLFFVSIALSAQSVAINNDGTTAHISAILDVKSTTKGFLAPRMTTLQRNAIASPTSGLLVYDTNLNTYFYRAGSVWKAVNVSIALADADNDTKIQVEESPNDNTIRFDINGTERMVLRENASGIPILELFDLADNLFVGTAAGASNTSGSNNTAFGQSTLSDNTTGYWNTALGFGSLRSNTTGNSNIGIGLSALVFNTTGSSNIGMGNKSLLSNTSGSGNISIGNQSLYNNSIGNGNLSIGDQTLQNNSSGGYNIAIGSASLFNNTQGSKNLTIGYAGMQGNTTGVQNVGVGYETLKSSTISQNNTALGYQAGRDFLHGNNNTFLGAFTTTNANSYTNSTAIGYQATLTASNQVRLGNASVSSIGGYQNWTNISDARLKNDVKADVPGLEFIKRLRPVTYVLDRNKIRETLGQEADSETQEGRSTGFLAQEVAAAAQASRFEFSGVDMPKNEQDFYGLRYAEFTVPLVKAVQELDAKNQELDAKNQALDAENQALRALITTMQARLDKLEAAK